jgi:hypothetical protein
MSRLEEKTG